jgi:hypothetical protein
VSNGFRSRATPEEQDALRYGPLGDKSIESVARPQSKPFDCARGEGLRRGAGQGHSVHGTLAWGRFGVRSPSRYGTSTRPWDPEGRPGRAQTVSRERLPGCERSRPGREAALSVATNGRNAPVASAKPGDGSSAVRRGGCCDSGNHAGTSRSTNQYVAHLSAYLPALRRRCPPFPAQVRVRDRSLIQPAHEATGPGAPRPRAQAREPGDRLGRRRWRVTSIRCRWHPPRSVTSASTPGLPASRHVNQSCGRQTAAVLAALLAHAQRATATW